MAELIEQKKNQKKEKIAPGTTRVKVGQFQLQTKSFWITVIAFITLFVFGVSYFTFYFAKYCIDKNTQLTEKCIQKNNEMNKTILQHIIKFQQKKSQ